MNLERRLAQISLLSDLPMEDVRQICRISVEKQFSPRQVIIKEGELADKFYFIIEGVATVFKKNKNGSITTLATLEEDAYFGEQGYQNFSIRTTSVQAETDVRLLEINYEVLDILLKKTDKSKILLEKQSLAKSIANLQSQLAYIDSYAKRELFTRSDKAKLKHYQKDDIIFNIGDKPEAVYFVSSGGVLLDFNPAEKGTQTLSIGESHIFGEIGVINDTPRAATALAKTTTSVIVIPKDDFLTVYKQNVSFKKLINSFERVYSLPHHEQITEQFVGTLDRDSAIFTKYLLPNKQILTCATSIDHPIFLINIQKSTADKIFKFKQGTNRIELSLCNDVLVGINASGYWPKLNALCEALFSQKNFSSADEKSFASYLE